MSERYDPEKTRENLSGIMECQLEWQGGPETAGQMLQLVPNLYAVSKKDALQLYDGIQKMGQYMTQMGKLIGQMQRRMDEMEARQAAVTVSHADVKRIQARIRSRADEICRKNNLQDKDSSRIFRAAIKKDVLRRHQVKDLHDLKAAALPGAETQIDRWTDIRLLMERRVST